MFRRGLIALALAGFCLNAYAAKWEIVVDFPKGDRLIADAESVKIDDYRYGNNDESFLVKATMMMVRDNKQVVMTVAIDAVECLTSGSGVMVITVNSLPEPSNFFWSANGNKVYDTQGVWLCARLRDIVNKHQSKTQKKPTTKQPNTKSENNTTI